MRNSLKTFTSRVLGIGAGIAGVTYILTYFNALTLKWRIQTYIIFSFIALTSTLVVYTPKIAEQFKKVELWLNLK